jgi:PAS domain S-box-containing protein
MTQQSESISAFDKIGWALLDAKADAVTILNKNGIILFANLTAAQQFGESVEEMIGKCIWDIYPITVKSHHKILVHQVIQTDQPITVVHQENKRWYQTLIYPIHDHEPGDQVDRIAICGSEVTAKIVAEERLKKARMEIISLQEDERHRISQDLHDDVGQMMTALVFELQAIRDEVKNGKKITFDEINGVIENLGLIIKHIRQIFYQLYPPSLNRMSLPKVLSGFCSTFEETNHIHVDFSYQEGIPEIPEDYMKTIYRFVQEALTNVAKHARASTAWINLDYLDEDLNISCEDNGVGFDLAQAREGIGFRGIRERFLILGGSIEIESAPGIGTRLSGTIPFKG